MVLSYPVLPFNFITSNNKTIIIHHTCTHAYAHSGFRYGVFYQTQTAHICFQKFYFSLAISWLYTCYLTWDLCGQYICSIKLGSGNWGVFIWDL